MVKEGHTVVGTLKITKIYNEHFKVDKKELLEFGYQLTIKRIEKNHIK